MNGQEAWDKFQTMDQKECMALRRCAQYQMREDPDLEEIGSSDINCHAVSMIQAGEWPLDRTITCKCGKVEEVPLGVLVDRYNEIVVNQNWISPVEVFNEFSMCSDCDHRLPDWAYDGKHTLDRESANMFNDMRELLS